MNYSVLEVANRGSACDYLTSSTLAGDVVQVERYPRRTSTELTENTGSDHGVQRERSRHGILK